MKVCFLTLDTFFLSILVLPVDKHKPKKTFLSLQTLNNLKLDKTERFRWKSKHLFARMVTKLWSIPPRYDTQDQTTEQAKAFPKKTQGRAVRRKNDGNHGLLVKYLLQGITTNADSYCHILTKLGWCCFILSKKKHLLKYFKWKTFDNQPYSPDLA